MTRKNQKTCNNQLKSQNSSQGNISTSEKIKLKAKKSNSRFSKIKLKPEKSLKNSKVKLRYKILVRDLLFNIKLFLEGLLALPWLLTNSGFVFLSLLFWSNNRVSNSFIGYLEVSKFPSRILWLACFVFILSNYTISFFVLHNLKSLNYLTSGVSLFLVIFVFYIFFYPVG